MCLIVIVILSVLYVIERMWVRGSRLDNIEIRDFRKWFKDKVKFKIEDVFRNMVLRSK